MEDPSNKRNTSSSPKSPSSPQGPPPRADEPRDVNPHMVSQNLSLEIYQGDGGGEVQKTPEQVLADLSTPPPLSPAPTLGLGEGQTGGLGLIGALAIGVGGSSMIVEGGLSGATAAGDVGAVKKTRKVSEVKDPPSGEPKCPECNKAFSTWKGAFGHMRSHPNRNYRGFFKPPTFSASSLVPAAGGSGGGESGEGGSSALVPVSKIWIDLNIAMEGAGDPIEGGNENAEDHNNSFRFDLNETASDDKENDEGEEEKEP